MSEFLPSKTMSLAVALSFADMPSPRATMQAPADTEGELREALRVLASAVRTGTERTLPADSRAICSPEGFAFFRWHSLRWDFRSNCTRKDLCRAMWEQVKR